MQCHIAKCKLLPIWQTSPQNTFLFNVTVLAQHLFIKCQLKHSAAYYVLGTSAALVKSKQFRKTIQFWQIYGDTSYFWNQLFTTLQYVILNFIFTKI